MPSKIHQEGFDIVVDTEDSNWVKQWKWELDDKGYVVRYENGAKGKYRFPLHREIWKRHKEIEKGVPITFKNGNTLDLRKSNLIICNQRRYEKE